MSRCPDCYGSGKCECGECPNGICFVCGGTGKDPTEFCEGEPSCNNGTCEAAPEARGLTNCVYCGKELRERDGAWYTWDAPFDGGIPQDYVCKSEKSTT